jgi:thiol-disulfide isomerase/thioredoxin
MREISGEQLAELVLDAKGTAVVDFWASWCMPCRELEVTLLEVEKKCKDATFYKVDVESNVAIAEHFGRLNKLSVYDANIVKILDEELPTFFTGQKSAQDVAP